MDPRAVGKEKQRPKPRGDGNPGTLILLRHGETTANRRGLILGQRDYPLTVEGRGMIRKRAAVLPKSRRGLIVTSPLGRAVVSAGIFADQTGWPVRVLDGLAELSCGLWEGRPREALIAERSSLRSTWEEAPPSGESYQDAEARVLAAIHDITVIPDHDPILVVGHAAINRVFLKIGLGWSPERAMKIQFEHDAIWILTFRFTSVKSSLGISLGIFGEGKRVS